MFVTAGLSASAAVLAMAVQAGLDDPPGSTSSGGGDAVVAADPDQPSDPLADADDRRTLP